MSHCNPSPVPGCSIPAQPIVVAVPRPGQCGEQVFGSVAGQVNQAQQTNNAGGYAYPVTASPATMPVTGSLVQIQVEGASRWANPGLLVWLPNHNGFLSVTGVFGDLITFRNLSIPQGVVLSAGTPIVPDAPPQPTDDEAAQEVTAMGSLSGVSDGLPVLMGGNLGEVIWRGSTTWQRQSANLFRFFSSPPDLLTIKRDVVGFTPGASTNDAKWATNQISDISAASTTGTVTFPSYPTVESGQSVRALVRVNWEAAIRESTIDFGVVRLKTTINGIVHQVQGFCMDAKDPSSYTNAAVNTRINAVAIRGSSLMVIPVPNPNAPVNVSFEFNKALTRSSPVSSDHANTHYKIDFTVLAYIL